MNVAEWRCHRRFEDPVFGVGVGAVEMADWVSAWVLREVRRFGSR